MRYIGHKAAAMADLFPSELHTWTWEYLLAAVSLMNFYPKATKVSKPKRAFCISSEYILTIYNRNTDQTDPFNYLVVFLKSWLFLSAVATR